MILLSFDPLKRGLQRKVVQESRNLCRWDVQAIRWVARGLMAATIEELPLLMGYSGTLLQKTNTTIMAYEVATCPLSDPVTIFPSSV